MAGIAGMDLGKQIGPLPLGAWVAVVAGGLGIAYVSRNSGGDDSPILVNDTSATPGVGVGGVGAYSPTDGGTSPITAVNPTITSNTQWGNAAFTYLVSMGTDGAVADKAVRDYLAGLPLSLQHNALISLCLAKLGQPPESLPNAPALPTPPPPKATPTPTPVKAVPKAAPKPVTAPQTPRGYYYRVVSGDSLWKIAARFYGSGSRWSEIYNANRQQIGSNPNRIYAGQTFLIPGK